MDFKKYVAEAIGTFWLVFAGIGSALTAAAFPQLGIGFLGVSLAVGLTVLTMAFSIGHISGCHLNPAVTVGLTAGGRFPASQVVPYIIAQVVGGLIAASSCMPFSPAPRASRPAASRRTDTATSRPASTVSWRCSSRRP